MEAGAAVELTSHGAELAEGRQPLRASRARFEVADVSLLICIQ